MSETMKVWNAVQQTDPKYTKGFKKGGGFSGTAINATYQIRRATELWGPIGGKWGYEVVTSEYVKGADNDIIHVLMIKFRHPDGAFDVFGQTTFAGANKNGKFTDEEAPKKSLTDAITKGLAMLGFSADVFLGLYDDNKYVNDLRQQAAQGVVSIAPNTATQVMKDEFDALPKELQHQFSVKVDSVRAHLDEGNVERGYDIYSEFRDSLEDVAHQAALRSLFNPAERSALQKENKRRAELKKAA